MIFLLIVALIVIIVAVLCMVYIKNKNETVNVKNNLQTEINFISRLNTVVNYNSVEQNNVDIPIYYINLKRSPKRNEFMQQQIRSHNIKQWTRIEGVDGKNDPSVQYTNKFSGLKTLTNGEIGCTLSHLRAVKQAYDDGVEYALILEDDACFDLVPHWEKSLSEVIANAPKDWNILQLYSDIDYTGLVGDYCCPDKEGINAILALSYIVHRKGMKEILDRVVKDNVYNLTPEIHYRGQADYYMYYILDGNTRYLTNPPLLMANNLDLNSTIHEHHLHLHLRMSLGTVDIYFNKILKDKKYHTLEMFNNLAEPKIIYNSKESHTQLDIVLAYHDGDFEYLLSMIKFWSRINYRIFVYSKELDTKLLDKYKPYISQLVQLNNVGGCDHSYIYHILNVPEKSEKTLFLNDKTWNYMKNNWLENNINSKEITGPIMKYNSWCFKEL